jgi:hypothetical protein
MFSNLVAPITLHTIYDANVLIDHTGPQFDRHQGAHILQRNYRDVRNDLIPPWEVRSQFRPGTLCIALVSFRMWSLTRDGDPDPDHVSRIYFRSCYYLIIPRQFYQLSLNKIRVVRESLENIEPIVRSEGVYGESETTVSATDFDGFDNGPSLKRRRSMCVDFDATCGILTLSL